MTTVTLGILGVGAGAYRVTLSGFGTGTEMASEELPGAEIVGADWPPERIRTFFASPEAGQPSPNLQAVGHQLAGWLLRGTIKARMDELRPNGLRVLLDIQVPELSDLPWELLWLGPVPSFLDVATPFARLRSGQPKARAEWPLRVLVVVGAAPSDDIGAESEISAIERELHPYGFSIDREVLRRPTKSVLFDSLGRLRPHVLLFIGHCDTDAVLGAPVLRFQLPKLEDAWNWTALDIAVDLNQLSWTPCLAVLNACRTHEPGASFAIADAFMDSGAAACITMQGDVRGDLAGVLSAAVLRGLCEGDPLDIALARARGSVRSSTNLLQRDWAFPVLSLAVEPEGLFPPRRECAARDGLAMAFPDTCWFVDRREERRRIRQGIGVRGAELPPQGLVVLTGPPRSGKSHLARWCLEQLAIVYDFRVRYVSAAGSGDEDFLSLLRRMRGMADEPDAFPPEVLCPLHWKLNALLAGLVPGPWNGEPADDRMQLYDPGVASSEHTVRDICAAFVEAFSTAARSRPMAFVLDQLTYADRSLEASVIRDVLVPNLLRPLRDGAIPGVLGLLVLEESECAKYGIDRLVPAEDWIRVQPDLPEPPDTLAREYFWFPGPEVMSGGLGDAIQSVEKRLGLNAAQPTPIRYVETLKKMALVLYESEDALRHLLRVRHMR